MKRFVTILLMALALTAFSGGLVMAQGQGNGNGDHDEGSSGQTDDDGPGNSGNSHGQGRFDLDTDDDGEPDAERGHGRLRIIAADEDVRIEIRIRNHGGNFIPAINNVPAFIRDRLLQVMIEAFGADAVCVDAEAAATLGDLVIPVCADDQDESNEDESDAATVSGSVTVALADLLAAATQPDGGERR